MLTLANGSDAKKWTIPKIYDNNISAIKPNGIDKVGETKPIIPTRKLNSIVIGIKGNIKIFTGRETREKTPVE